MLKSLAKQTGWAFSTNRCPDGISGSIPDFILGEWVIDAKYNHSIIPNKEI
jgi:hypothetical protein